MVRVIAEGAGELGMSNFISCSKQRILLDFNQLTSWGMSCYHYFSKILPYICLPKSNKSCWIKFLSLRCGSCCDSKPLYKISAHQSWDTICRLWFERTYQWCIIHRIHHNPLMFWAIFAPPSHVCLYYTSPIQKWHFTIGLDPHFVSCMWSYYIERGDM